MNLARAFRWQALIDSGTYRNTVELSGNLPDGFRVDCLKQAIPVLWSEQKKFLGIE